MRRLTKLWLTLLLGALLTWLTVQASLAVPRPETGSHAGATDTIVGRWEALRKCSDIVQALDAQGLGSLAPAVVGDYFPNATYDELAAKEDVCSGAKPQHHYHFFTADGFFGSLDQKPRSFGLRGGAPGRIRTCAPASGGRCSIP
jgi:hypothetical protein